MALPRRLLNLHFLQKDTEFNSKGQLEISEVALTELLQNALVHRDYFKNSPIRVFVFKDRGDIPFFLSLYQALLTVIVYSSFSLIFHSCSGLLRHTTIIDVIKVFMATTFSFVVLFILSFFSRWFALSNILNLPLSVIVIHYVLISVTLFSFRISIKISFYLITASFTKKKKVLIMGAGDMGVIVKRVILSDMANGDHKVRI